MNASSSVDVHTAHAADATGSIRTKLFVVVFHKARVGADRVGHHRIWRRCCRVAVIVEIALASIVGSSVAGSRIVILLL